MGLGWNFTTDNILHVCLYKKKKEKDVYIFHYTWTCNLCVVLGFRVSQSFFYHMFEIFLIFSFIFPY